jgi:hypothetical protein
MCCVKWQGFIPTCAVCWGVRAGCMQLQEVAIAAVAQAQGHSPVAAGTAAPPTLVRQVATAGDGLEPT